MAEASEEEWQRRQETVARIKASPDYLALPAGRRPGTPDSNDRMMSKRSWETKVMQWRNVLKDLSQLEKEKAQLLMAISAEFKRLSFRGEHSVVSGEFFIKRLSL